MRQFDRTRARGRVRHAGFSLLEVSTALGVTAVALAAMMATANDAQKQVRDAAAADRLAQVYAAAVAYSQSNASTLATSTTVGGTPLSVSVGRTTAGGTVPSGSLQALGYLPASYVDQNTYGQTHLVAIRQPTAGNFDVLVETTGGQTIPDLDLGRIAQKVGGVGGMVMTKPPSSAGSYTLQGVGGGWAETPSSWTTGGVTPSAGHVMAISYANQTTMIADFLYRNKIPGVPEANRMHTNIDMNSNQLNNTQEVDNGTASSTASDATHDITVGSPLTGSGTVPSQGMTGQVVMDSGLYACRGNVNGCEMQLSDDGGFKDNNDGFATYTSTSTTNGGIRIGVSGTTYKSPNNQTGQIEASGQATFDSLTLHYGNVQMKGSTQLSWPDIGTTYLTEDTGNILHLYGGNLTVDGNGRFGGNVYAKIFYDAANNAYYVQPSATSILNIIQAQDIGLVGFSPTSGYVKNPETSQTITGGVHTYDVQAEGGLYVGGTNGGATGGANGTVTPKAWMLSDGNGGVTGQFTLGQTAIDGNACSPNGAIDSKSDGSGTLMSCYNGIWTPTTTTAVVSFFTLPNGVDESYSIGTHYYCALADTFEEMPPYGGVNNSPNATRVYITSTASNGRPTWTMSRGALGQYGGAAYCIDY